MPIKAEDVTWVEEPQFGLLEAMYLPAIAEGVKTTLKHLFRPTSDDRAIPRGKTRSAASTIAASTASIATIRDA